MIEAGAHDGSDAAAMAKVMPDVDIWAFEAHPAVCNLFALNARYD